MPSKAYIGRSSKEPKGSVRQVRSVSRTIATWAHHILSFAVSPTPQGVAVAVLLQLNPLNVSKPISDGLRSAKSMDGKARSEEHTSELQSLMRISYAVFCLKKKNKRQQNKQT